ncbi:MAG: GxxExxY protein [Rhodobacteraceae bacterium]|nr:GxxExxY protein [Paracoccaceae bacterium]
MNNEDITVRIIGAAIAVHRALGPGFLEEVYEEALAIEFEELGIPFERQRPVPITYRGRRIKDHRLDFLVDGRIVVELKAVSELEPIFFAIVRSYLKATNLQDGLILNFATMPLTIKRVGREDSARRTPPPLVPDFLSS